jgi:hypothetical protein
MQLFSLDRPGESRCARQRQARESTQGKSTIVNGRGKGGDESYEQAKVAVRGTEDGPASARKFGRPSREAGLGSNYTQPTLCYQP